ncbi:MAG: ATPase associated with various cellular activity 3 [Deltaproteobacteria bacterium]|nr:ATPase associated with various cellular activity 3 [Deltaproteobacteria bacterium]
MAVIKKMDHNQSHQLQQIITELTARHLPGKAKPLRLALTALLTGGHILIEDIPGLGKTTLAIALANSLGLSFGRVQCTSDLLPADITGLTIFDRQENSFRFVKGPVFNNILLVDEINRAMPKTQSALLEAMEEHRVTADGVTYPLPDPFLVIATQNPAEQVGTYPLPESQMDRFLIRTGMGYPAAEIEKEIIRYGSIRHDILTIAPMVTPAEIAAGIRSVAAATYLSAKLADYIYSIVAATRSHPLILTGISTRGAINLAQAAKAHAFLDNRDHVLPEDIKEMTAPVGSHRLIMRAGHDTIDKESLLNDLLQSIPIPLS